MTCCVDVTGFKMGSVKKLFEMNLCVQKRKPKRVCRRFFLFTLNSNHFSGKRFVAFIQSYIHQEDPKSKRVL